MTAFGLSFSRPHPDQRVFDFSFLIKIDSQLITLAYCARRSYRDRIAAPKGVRLKCADIFISHCALRNTDLDRKKGLFVGQHVCLPVSGKKRSTANGKRENKSFVLSSLNQFKRLEFRLWLTKRLKKRQSKFMRTATQQTFSPLGPGGPLNPGSPAGP